MIFNHLLLIFEKRMRLLGKVALVTGATGQLGRQFCHALAREGATVWVSDLDIDKCKAVVSDLTENSPHYPLILDVADPESVQNAFSEIKKVSGTLDIIINNAGIAVFTPFEERTLDEFMNVLRVNAGGTFLGIQAGAKLMRERKTKGSIINIGSIYGMVSGDPRVYTDCSRKTAECYGASKAAIIHMTKYFAVHLAEFGIRVNCISPGGVFNYQGEDFVKNYSYRTPMGRMANETEIAGTAVFLASDEASYITGQNIAVDGGWTSW
jgi:NAD(P)-dependent dehydrogenase (short-subunit alcohol dehydrogenase family)